jgi:hypothetical protein
MPPNTAIFTIGRMNPPTSGHMKLIQTMMEFNIALPPDDLGHGNIYIILSHTQNNIKDPLSCERKRELLEAKGIINQIKIRNPLFKNIKVTIFCKDDPLSGCETINNWILKPICHIIELNEETTGEKPTKMVLFIGEDRAESYKDFLFKYGPKMIEFDYFALPRPKGSISATEMRALVTSGQMDEFVTAVIENGLSRDEAEHLFLELKTLLDTTKSKKYTTPKVKTPKVKTPGKSTPSRKSAKGGRRRQRKSRKNKTYKKFKSYKTYKKNKKN